jgi:hypothetical protein
MENPDNEDIIIQTEETLPSVLWPNSITTFFPFPVMFYLPCADHVLLFVDDVVTSWPQTKISDWSEITFIVILAVQNRTCSIPKCASCKLLKVAWYRVIALFTLYVLVYDTSIMILAFPCKRGVIKLQPIKVCNISYLRVLFHSSQLLACCLHSGI